MKFKLSNASMLPKRYYGLHFAPGVAEYKRGKEAYRVFLNEDTCKKMDKTFEGKPVYVQHVDEVDLAKLHEADGYVVKSFFNKHDGKHWVEFMVVSDEGHKAIAAGWRLSNAYFQKQTGDGGLWHGVQYRNEVLEAEYEHLAIVDNPRYDESLILTPDQFKKYNLEKEIELQRIANSKDKKETKSMFNIFKKEKVENSADLEAMSVLLPESKKEVTVAEAIKAADKFHNMHGYANGDHMVKAGEEEMSVNEMTKKYCSMKKNMEEEALRKKEAEGEEEEKKNKKKNEEDAEAKKQNELEVARKDAEAKAAQEEITFLEKLANAGLKPQADSKEEVYVDRVSLGKQRYGSN